MAISKSSITVVLQALTACIYELLASLILTALSVFYKFATSPDSLDRSKNALVDLFASYGHWIIIGAIVLWTAFICVRHSKKIQKIKESYSTRLKEEEDKNRETEENYSARLKEEENKNREIEDKLIEARKYVCDGKEYKINKATIKFIPKNGENTDNRYRFTFEKEYVILADKPEWYQGQIYCNKFTTNLQMAKSYYKEPENKIEWDDLSFKANMSINQGGEKKELEVESVSESERFINFHINYKYKNTGHSIPLKEGDHIKLCYSYELPTRLWGTYLNRTISYFCEKASVILEPNDKTMKNTEIVLSEIPATGQLIQLDGAYKFKEDNAALLPLSIDLPEKASPVRYCIQWKATEIFGDRTESDPIVGRDTSGVTNL